MSLTIGATLLLAVLQVQPQTAGRAAGTASGSRLGALSAKDSAKLVGRVRDREDRFFRMWRRAWQIEQLDIADSVWRLDHDTITSRAGDIDLTPRAHGTCALDQSLRYDTDPFDRMQHLVSSPINWEFNFCVSWQDQRRTHPPDERKTVDVAFSTRARAAAQLEREPLLLLLDSAATALPGDGFVAGQRVRLNIDQQKQSAAYKAALACRGEAWWCAALRGYVLHVSDHEPEAAVAFDQMLAAMPDSIRCDWDDVTSLLNAGERIRYAAMSCTEHQSLNETIWWLADPLYLEPGNQRRTEQFSRKVLTALHGALKYDERFKWTAAYQGPSLGALIDRYGWPNYMEWYGRITTVSIACTASIPDSVAMIETGPLPGIRWFNGGRAPSNEPPGIFPPALSLTLAQCVMLQEGGLMPAPSTHFVGPANHTMPRLDAALDPFHAKESDWDVAPGRLVIGGRTYWDESWFPPELFKRDAGMIVPLPSQTGFIRRQSASYLVAAAEWDSTAIAPTIPRDPVFGVVALDGPRSPTQATTSAASLTGPSSAIVPVLAGAHLIALEVVPRNVRSGVAARTRFAADAPPPLAKLPVDSIAISDPFLVATNAAAEIPANIEAVAGAMLGTTRLFAPGRLTVSWELYGLAAADSAMMSLRVVRAGDRSVVAVVGGLLGFGSVDSVSLSWTERPASTSAFRTRGIIVDLSRQPAGDYFLELIAKRGAALATSRRTFRIER